MITGEEKKAAEKLVQILGKIRLIRHSAETIHKMVEEAHKIGQKILAEGFMCRYGGACKVFIWDSEPILCRYGGVCEGPKKMAQRVKQEPGIGYNQ